MTGHTEDRMARHYAEAKYHRPGDRYWHFDAECPDGMKIPKDDRERGDGALERCPRCGDR